MENKESDFWNNLPDKVKQNIKRGLKDIEAGRVHKHEDVMQEIKMRHNVDRPSQDSNSNPF